MLIHSEQSKLNCKVIFTLFLIHCKKLFCDSFGVCVCTVVIDLELRLSSSDSSHDRIELFINDQSLEKTSNTLCWSEKLLQ